MNNKILRSLASALALCAIPAFAGTVKSASAGPLHTLTIDISSLSLDSTTLHGVQSQCWTGAGFSAGDVTGRLAPLKIVSIDALTTSSITINVGNDSQAFSNVVCAVSGGSGGSTSPGSIVKAGLIAEYLLREGSGTTIHDTSGNASDGTLGGTGSEGVMNSPTWVAQGLHFDGTAQSGRGQVASLPANSIFIASSADMTSEVWASVPAAPGTFGAFWAFGDDAHFLDVNSQTTTALYLEFLTDFPDPLASGQNNNTFDGYSYDGFAAVSKVGIGINTWAQIVTVRDTEHKELRLYINSALVARTSNSFGGAGGADTHLQMAFVPDDPLTHTRFIGADGYTTDGLTGTIGELRFYDRALNDNEIAQNWEIRRSEYASPEIGLGAGVNNSAVLFSFLPPCDGSTEGIPPVAVSDSSTITWGATITGGGANHVLAHCDGTNWTVSGK